MQEAAGHQLSHTEFLELILQDELHVREQRLNARRVKAATFMELKPLEDFDWEFNKAAIDRVQIEELVTGEFLHRGENLVPVGQSGVGKSRLLQSLGRRFCASGRRVRYTTSGQLLSDLTAGLADQTLAKRLRYWSRFELLIIHEFGFDRIERDESPQSASLLYKIIDARHGRCSTALPTNIDFDAWGD